jgi:hypothetical protein
MIAIHDIAEQLIVAGGVDEISPARLVEYYRTNRSLLERHLDAALKTQALASIDELAARTSQRLTDGWQGVLANYYHLQAVLPRVRDMLSSTAIGLRNLSIVVTVGAYQAGGWAEQSNGGDRILLAIEVSAENPDILVAHEAAHLIGWVPWSTVLDGFINEGFASFASSVLCPGHPLSDYLIISGADYKRYTEWIRKNGTKLSADKGKPLTPLNPEHKFYFTTSFNPECPNIGYIVGFHFMKWLWDRKSVDLSGKWTMTSETAAFEFDRFLTEFCVGFTARKT